MPENYLNALNVSVLNQKNHFIEVSSLKFLQNPWTHILQM